MHWSLQFRKCPGWVLISRADRHQRYPHTVPALHPPFWALDCRALPQKLGEVGGFRLFFLSPQQTANGPGASTKMDPRTPTRADGRRGDTSARGASPASSTPRPSYRLMHLSFPQVGKWPWSAVWLPGTAQLRPETPPWGQLQEGGIPQGPSTWSGTSPLPSSLQEGSGARPGWGWQRNSGAGFRETD